MCSDRQYGVAGSCQRDHKESATGTYDNSEAIQSMENSGQLLKNS